MSTLGDALEITRFTLYFAYKTGKNGSRIAKMQATEPFPFWVGILFKDPPAPNLQQRATGITFEKTG